MMWLWSQGRVAYLPDFFQPKVLGCVPLPLLQVAAVTYWRELHFYWCILIPSPQTLNLTPHSHYHKPHTSLPLHLSGATVSCTRGDGSSAVSTSARSCGRCRCFACGRQQLLSFSFLRYKHVHKVHHKSKNPGPWSGLSM